MLHIIYIFLKPPPALQRIRSEDVLLPLPANLRVNNIRYYTVLWHCSPTNTQCREPAISWGKGGGGGRGTTLVGRREKASRPAHVLHVQFACFAHRHVSTMSSLNAALQKKKILLHALCVGRVSARRMRFPTSNAQHTQ